MVKATIKKEFKIITMAFTDDEEFKAWCKVLEDKVIEDEMSKMSK